MAPAPKLRARLREATRQAILEAAEEVFAQQGLPGAHMERIAARAGVSVGTLYNHFEDRQALLGALREHLRQALLGAMDRALEESAGQPFRDQLTGFYTALLREFCEHREFFSILLQSEHSPAAARQPLGAPSPLMQAIYSRAEALVQTGVRQRAVREPLAGLLPWVCVGILRSALVRDLLYEPTELSASERAKQLVDFYMDGAAR